MALILIQLKETLPQLNSGDSTMVVVDSTDSYHAVNDTSMVPDNVVSPTVLSCI